MSKCIDVFDDITIFFVTNLLIASAEEKQASLTADNDVFRFLAKTYATNHWTMHKKDPCPNVKYTSSKDGISNGALWDEIDGNFVFFSFQFNSFDIELTYNIQVFIWWFHIDYLLGDVNHLEAKRK